MSTTATSSVQQLYELLFCLWTMTYDCVNHPSIRQHFHRDKAVAALSELVAAAPREKVVRLALSSLRNLAHTDSTFVQEMIGCGVLKSIDLLQDRQWSDPDILEGTKRITTPV
jgi:V-type H+-transporting ATPase subunit H